MKGTIGNIYSTRRRMLFLAVLIFAWFNLTSAQSNTYNLFQDRDQDGLTDIEEVAYGTDPDNQDTDKDGYSDSTEVKSGYDPLKPAPGDKLVVLDQTTESSYSDGAESDAVGDDINLTDKLLSMLNEEKKDEFGVIKDFGQDPSNFQNEEKISELLGVSVSQEDIDSLLSSTLNSANIKDELEIIPESEIKIIPKPSGKTEEEIREKEKKQIEEYFVAAGYVFVENAPFTFKNQDELSSNLISMVTQLGTYVQGSDIERLEEMKDKAETGYDKLKEIEVPETIKDIHLTGLSLFKYFIDQDVSALSDESDPVQQALLVSKGQAALLELESLKSAVEEVLEEYDITAFSSPEDILSRFEETEDEEDAE